MCDQQYDTKVTRLQGDMVMIIKQKVKKFKQLLPAMISGQYL